LKRVQQESEPAPVWQSLETVKVKQPIIKIQ
jgi:hypothetical protein